MRYSDLSDDAALNEYLSALDDRLGAEDIAIPGRPLRALSQISAEFRASFMLNSPIANRVNQWFQTRYGDKLKMTIETGRMVVKIKHDLYAVHYPVIFGQVMVNPFTWLRGVPSGVWPSLPKDEIGRIAEKLEWGYERVQRISYSDKKITADIQTAITFLLSHHPDYALSKWASLQAAEKMLKAFLTSKGATFPFTHKLGHLLKLCEQNGLPKLAATDSLIAQIQCGPGIRYDQTIAKDEALAAHHACIELCAMVSDHLPRR